jgi:hypothetical protein
MLHVKPHSPFDHTILDRCPSLLGPNGIQVLFDKIVNLQIILGKAD